MDVKELYQEKLRAAGEHDHRSVGYVSRESQEARWRVLYEATCMPHHCPDYLIESVLDVGCGQGEFSEWWPRQDYTGLDVVPEFIDVARARYGSRHRAFTECDVMNPHLAFVPHDLVVAAGTFAWQSPEVCEAMLQKMWEATKVILAFTLSETATLSYFLMTMQSLNVKDYIVRHDFLPNDTAIYCYR